MSETFTAVITRPSTRSIGLLEVLADNDGVVATGAAFAGSDENLLAGLGFNVVGQWDRIGDQLIVEVTAMGQPA